MTSDRTTLVAERPSGVEVFRDGSTEWEACERALAASGVRLPLPHRAGWAGARRGVEALLVVLRSANSSCATAIGVHAAASRAVPGFHLLRVERFGEAVPHALRPAAVAALAEVARRRPRVLRLSVEVFSRDGEARARFADLLTQAGFTRAASTRNWDRTLALDLQPSESDLFASFSATVRRTIRSGAKLPVQVRSIEDRRLGDRMEALSRETFARTGARYQALWDWGGVVELSQRIPDASRLVGLFRTDGTGPDTLLGFAWGVWNGESVSYFAGASSRPSDLQGVGIAHPLFWDLIVWAKRAGATWFDLGGVTAGTARSGDPVGGISDFKRLFSKETVAVAEDWVLEPYVLPARLAAVVRRGAAWLGPLTSRLRPRGPTAHRTSPPERAGAGGRPTGPVNRSPNLLFRLVAADAVAPALRALGRGLVSIFTLHRFANPEQGVVGHDPAALRDQLAYLRRHRYRLLGLTDVLRLIEDDGGDRKAPAVAFTVDDGYAGFARVAPIFAEYDCPVTLFVTTGFVDGQLWLWWDRVRYLFEHAQRSSFRLGLGSEHRSYQWATPAERAGVKDDVIHRLEWVDAPEREAAIIALSEQLDVELPTKPPPAFAPISWDDVRRTASLGATFGPHTVTHRILSLAPDQACDWEIQESYRRLRQETDACIPVFCYPNGERRAFGQRELEAVQRAGFKAALTTLPGYIASLSRGDGGALARFALPRFPFPDDRPHLVNVVAGLSRLKRRLPRLHRGALRRGLNSA